MMITRILSQLAFATFALCGSMTVALGQDQPVKRTDLLRAPIEGVEGKEVVAFMAEFAPGAKGQRHSHPGQEFVFVLEGELILEPDQGSSETHTAGNMYVRPAQEIHSARNVSDTNPAKVLILMVTDSGQPSYIPAD